MAGSIELSIQRSAARIQNAKALIITAGAGLGVDSGLPDFRGPEGFWKAYPPLRERGLTLPDTSTPDWFETDPHFAWGFFGHRFNLYKKTIPHHGFQILRKWCESMEKSYFVFTSNVDGHFQKAGFSQDKVVECHGSINFLQAVHGFDDIWPFPDNAEVDINEKTLRANSSLPKGPPGQPKWSQVLARPNILMFNDCGWMSDRSDRQEKKFHAWINEVQEYPLVVIEVGAGTYVPTIRRKSRAIVNYVTHEDSCLVRINPNEAEVERDDRDISLPMTGIQALTTIDACLSLND